MPAGHVNHGERRGPRCRFRRPSKPVAARPLLEALRVPPAFGSEFVKAAISVPSDQKQKTFRTYGISNDTIDVWQ